MDANDKITKMTRVFQIIAQEARLSGDLKLADTAKGVAENLPESSKLRLFEILNETKEGA